MSESIGEIANVPNGITGVRLVGSVCQAFKYGQTGDIKHLIGAAAYFGLDVFDGPVARLLGQETEFGAGFDPTVDKISIAAIGAAAVAQKDIDPLVLAAVGGINISNVAATVIANKRGRMNVHGVTHDAKMSQIWMNSGAGLHIVGKNLHRNAETSGQRLVGNIFRFGGGAIAVAAAATKGRRASAGFWREALR